ncbi:MAG: long-chain fatty acid--CoA ligase [Desulfobacteraceae bacterium]|nr:MAG: long-chain fatty acid--CoA ligase [Desulfobacteraceae bacterium]
MNDMNTFPKLLLRQFEQGPERVAMRKKDFGIWKEYTWRDSYENVRYLSLCFLSLGLKQGDKVAIIGENEPQWFWAEFAAQAVGGIMVGIYTDMVPAQVQFMFSYSNACIAVANDQEQVDKFLEIKGSLPALKKIIYWEGRGLRHYDDPLLLSYNDAVALGRAYDKNHPDAFEKCVQAGSGEDIAALYYTSGTSGTPKAGMVSHRALISSGKAFLDYNHLTSEDNLFSYLPAAWIGEGMFGTAAHLVGGVTLNFAEEPETVQQDMREIGPQVVSYGPRQWEDMARGIQVRIREAGLLNRFLYRQCEKIGYMRGALAEKGARGKWWQRILILCADLLVFFPLRENLGLRRCRIATTGSSAMSVDTFRFWSALGLRLKQVYGSTEAGFVAGHRSEEIFFETLGNVSTCAEVKISAEQEILVKGPQIFSGYYRDPAKAAEAVNNGWVKTGDAGFIDKKGHLVFLDRLKDLNTLSNGTRYAPQYIEGRLRFSPYIKDALVLGGEKRAFIAVIVIIDFANTGKWAEENHLTYTTYADLSQKEAVAELISRDIRRVNDGFQEAIKVKKFVVLHKEFDPDEEELTRTRKIRRSFMEERYRELVDAIYEGKSGLQIETPVKYRDGRQTLMKTYIKICTPFREQP